MLIHTERLLLREISLPDFVDVERIRLSIASDPSNLTYYDLEKKEDSYKVCRQAVEEQKVTPRQTLSLAITEKKAPHKMIGFIIGELTELGDWQGETGLCDLGYFMDSTYQGKGYVTEAARAFVSRVFFEDLNYAYINATVDPVNTPSIRVLQALGFTQYGEILEKRGGKRMYMHVSRDEFYTHKNSNGENKNVLSSQKVHIVRGLLPQTSYEREL